MKTVIEKNKRDNSELPERIRGRCFRLVFTGKKKETGEPPKGFDIFKADFITARRVKLEKRTKLKFCALAEVPPDLAQKLSLEEPRYVALLSYSGTVDMYKPVDIFSFMETNDFSLHSCDRITVAEAIAYAYDMQLKVDKNLCYFDGEISLDYNFLK